MYTGTNGKTKKVYYYWHNPSTLKNVGLGADRVTANQAGLELNEALLAKDTTQKFKKLLRKAKLPVRKASKTVNEIVDHWDANYWQARIQQGIYNVNSYKAREKPQKKFTEKFLGDLPITGITYAQLAQLLRDQKANQSQARNDGLKRYWEGMFAWAISEGWCPQDHNPAIHILKFKDKGGDTRRKRARLIWPWYEKIYDYATINNKTTDKLNKNYYLDTWFRDAIVVQFYTGTDRNTVMSMKFTDIVNGNWLYTRKKTQKHKHANVRNKLPEPVLKILKERQENEPHEYVFTRINKSKKPFRRIKVADEYYTKAFSSVVRASGINELITVGETPPTTHEIRSLAGTVHLVYGYTIEDVQRLYAHGSTAQTIQYVEGHNTVPVEYTDAKPLSASFEEIRNKLPSTDHYEQAERLLSD